MNLFVRLVTLMIIAGVSYTAWGSISVFDFRHDSTVYFEPILIGGNSTMWLPDNTTSGCPYGSNVVLHSGPTGTTMMVVYSASDKVGVPMDRAPECAVDGPSEYTDGTGHYKVTCEMLVKYADSNNFQTYDPSKKNLPIGTFALNTIWTRDGVVVNPKLTLLPGELSNKFQVFAYTSKGMESASPWFETDGGIVNQVTVRLNIDDVKYVTGDEAVINYDWKATGSRAPISAMYATMYMEQLDSNIDLTYDMPDGGGEAVIVPNTQVTIEDPSKRLMSNGQIKLKLASKTGFGTRSTRLRVTVDWQ